MSKTDNLQCDDNAPFLKMTDPISLGLPHRAPFVFIESVDRLEAGWLAECSKTFHGTELFFHGHFPGNAIVPGVLLVEGMAQTAGIAIGRPGKIYLLTAIRSMKFLRPVRPLQLIRFKAEKIADVAGLVQCAVEARVGENLAAQGQVVLAEELNERLGVCIVEMRNIDEKNR